MSDLMKRMAEVTAGNAASTQQLRRTLAPDHGSPGGGNPVDRRPGDNPAAFRGDLN